MRKTPRFATLIAGFTFAHSAVCSEPNNNSAMKALLDDGSHISQATKYYQDLDQDGVLDKNDLCPNTALGTTVNKYGCILDSDKDGVPDKNDLCPNSSDKTNVNSFGCETDTHLKGIDNTVETGSNAPQNHIIDTTGYGDMAILPLPVTFALNAWKLSNTQKTRLATQTEQLKKLPSDEIILITGYTDTTGSAQYNLKLSWKRANSVKQYLIKHVHIKGRKIYILGKGQSNPIASNKTLSGRQKNRRSEFSIVKLQQRSKIAVLTIPKHL